MLQTLRTIKNYLSSIPAFYQYIYTQRESLTKDKAVYFIIRKNPYKRYLYTLIKFFDLSGYTVYIKKDLALFQTLKNETYTTFLLKERIIYFGVPSPEANPVTIDEQILSPNYFNRPISDVLRNHSYYVPMSQHPLMYYTGWWKQPIEKVKRKRSLFMAGNFNAADYGAIQTDRLFNVMSRLEVYACLDDKKLLFPIGSLSDIVLFLQQDIDHQIILVDRLLVDIPMQELRNLLGKFDFYFALSGVVIPFSHNIIEAMSVGCIPFMQEEYAKMFSPALVNGKQVITFKNSEDLEERIAYLFTLNETEIAQLRDEVNRYYENYLTPSAVVAKIEENSFETIYLQAEHYSVALINKASSGSAGSTI